MKYNPMAYAGQVIRYNSPMPLPSYSQAEQITTILDGAHHIVIVQADNPDADSLGSALALEAVLGDMGKQTTMYCGVDMPTYLRYLEGWDRVVRDLPRQFDASIIVDASTSTLLEKLQQSGQQHWLASKPCVVLDHHAEVSNPINYATVTLNDHTRSSTGELLYTLGKQIGWPLGIEAQTHMMTAILGDTQGLSNQLTSADTYRVMAGMTDEGVDRGRLEERRRETNKMPAVIFRYKAALIDRTELLCDGQLAFVRVPQTEIAEYSPLYNPAPLIQGDMLQTAGVRVSVVLKTYDDGKATAAIRCNHGSGIGGQLAERFGGGGHAYASGFKILKAAPWEEIRDRCAQEVNDLLRDLDQA